MCTRQDGANSAPHTVPSRIWTSFQPADGRNECRDIGVSMAPLSKTGRPDPFLCGDGIPRSGSVNMALVDQQVSIMQSFGCHVWHHCVHVWLVWVWKKNSFGAPRPFLRISGNIFNQKGTLLWTHPRTCAFLPEMFHPSPTCLISLNFFFLRLFLCPPPPLSEISVQELIWQEYCRKRKDQTLWSEQWFFPQKIKNLPVIF